MDMEVNLRLDMEVMQGHTMLVESEPQGAGKDTIFAELIEEAKRAASDGGTMSRFSLTVKLLQAKSYYRISNVAFNAILLILALQYPTSSIPKSYEEALSIIGRLGLGYDSIHVCPNNCVLFRKDYAKENNCPKCKASRWKDADGRRQIPEKVLRHFPLIPRLQRMFLSKEQSKEVQWHKLKRQDVENDLSHPADGDAWKDFDNIHKDFAADARNIRLGLATDGFNPYGNMSNSYSMWPVFVVPYNLPPWACMDQSNFMLALLIPGPSSPGKDFDVFMEPLMEELQELWKGVKSYDANSPDKFDLRAAILWCIHDYPALHTLSGRATAGYQACVRCDKENCSKKLRNKICFIGHRRWLPRQHPWRNSKEFDGASESREKPAEFTPEELKQQLDRVRDVIPGKLQKKRKREDGQCWSRRSCLWDLPYWEDLKLRHNLDVMHIEKNICDNLIGTFMNIQGKTKDTVNSRLDLEDMGIRRDLHLQPVSADSFEMPQAWYTMSKQEKIAFCEFIKAVRFPDGYASNISKCVASDKCKLQGLKTHDCHILLQRILPAGLRGTIHEDIYEAVAELGNFFRELCCKTLKRDVLDRLEKEIVVILCKLEKIFPPSFFDVMVHLAIHLPKEARLRGPVHYGWMYPVERRLLTLKRYVRNNARPEGSIAEAYIVDECLTFCSRYFDDVETRFNRPSRNPERDDSHIGDLSVFKHGVKFIGASQYVYAGEDYDNMVWYVLRSCPEVDPYIDLCKQELNQRGGQINVDRWLAKNFARWFQTHIGKMRNDVCPDLYALACKPDFRVRLYSACVVDSVRYHTVDREKNRKTQNSGIVSEGDHDGNSIDFFGQLKSIIRLQYNSSGGVHRSVVLFRCDWFDLGGRKPGFDDDGHFKSVNTEKFWYKTDPFILTSQATKMDGGERAKKPILSEMTSHSVTSDIPDNKMDVGEGTKKRMLCEMTSKSVCSDIPDDKKHRVEENSILSDDKGEMACQSFKPPTPPCLLSMETDAAGPGTDEPIPGIIVSHEEGCGLGLPPAVETGGAAGAASVEPLVNGVVPREFSELEQNGLPIVKTDITGADAGVATDDPAPEVCFVLVEPVMTMPTVLTGGGPGAGRVEPLAKGVVPRESSEVDIGGLPSVETSGLPGAGIVEISASGPVREHIWSYYPFRFYRATDSYEPEHVPDANTQSKPRCNLEDGSNEGMIKTNP
ncbi:hypothetical protein QYE76_062232 [Lolium multiflorum]|uniref:Uncharacterized protein n=1 Tax=Lolium multiflorum TaxID=4521 RepID=A0AAD8S5A6_LOLMU|nr:hypothetical protein QYE76_062232 [Lolium multiflorum]